VRGTVAAFEKISSAPKIAPPITAHLGHNAGVRLSETKAPASKALGHPHRARSLDKNCGHNTGANGGRIWATAAVGQGATCYSARCGE
jgi:hypothetical protein